MIVSHWDKFSSLGTHGSEHFKGCFPRAFVTALDVSRELGHGQILPQWPLMSELGWFPIWTNFLV